MNKIYYDKLNYTLFTETLSNGLKVMYIKKPGFHRYSCYFGCNMGGKINKYYYDGKFYEIPLGVAHFLEHQMFEMPDGVNASDYLAQYGLDNNAYTSYDKTMYLVSGSDNFEIAVNYLLDFVQTPYFKNENIDVEREIIIQELMMYQDRPLTKLRQKLKLNLYGDTSYSNDVGGSVEEVRKVDENILNQVYNHFYTPQNMYFAVVGSYDENVVFDLIRKNQEKKVFVNIALPIAAYDKPQEQITLFDDQMKIDTADDFVACTCRIKYDLKSLEVNNKDKNKKNLMTVLLTCELLSEILFGPSSKNYQEILDKDLANIGFSCNINVDDDFFDFTFSGYSHHKEELIQYVKNILTNLDQLEVDENYLLTLNKASLGMSLREYNSLDNTVSNAIDFAMDNINSFDYYNYMVKKEDILEIAKSFDISSFCTIIGNGNRK